MNRILNNFSYIIIFVFNICWIYSFKITTMDYSLEKCVGVIKKNINAEIPNNHSKHHLQTLYNITSGDLCRFICFKQTYNCWMISYHIKQQICQLYDAISFEYSNGNSQISYFQCENNIKCVKLPNKCYAYQVDYQNLKLQNFDNHILLIRKVENAQMCDKLCGKIYLCGSLIYDRLIFQCTIFIKSVMNNSKIYDTFDSTFTTKSWMCCTDEKYLPNSVSFTRYIYDKIMNYKESGKWMLDKYFRINTVRKQTMMKFQISDPVSCLSVCSLNPFCIKPFVIWSFEVTCLLVLNPVIGNPTDFIDLRWEISKMTNIKQIITWYWTSTFKYIPKEVGRAQKLKCVCIKPGSTLMLKLNSCIYWKTIQLQSQLNIFINVSFAKNSEVNVELNDTKYILKYISGKYNLCNASLCELYQQLMNTKHESFKIIKRKEIYLKRAINKSPNELPGKLISILNTYNPGRCYHYLSCSHYVRQLQYEFFRHFKYDDVAYNFLIGEDGNVYEGRGWHRKGAHTFGFNHNIGIAFIGWFKDHQANVKALRALKNLIVYGIREGYFDIDVNISCHRDLRNSEVPGIMLYHQIHNLEFRNYQLFKPNHLCYPDLHRKMLLTAIITTISLSFILIYLIYIYIFRHRSQICRILKQSKKPISFIILDTLKDFDIFNDYLFILHDQKSFFNLDRCYSCECSYYYKVLWLYSYINMKKDLLKSINKSSNILFCHNSTVFIKLELLDCLNRYFIVIHLPADQVKKAVHFISNFSAIFSLNCFCSHFTITKLPPNWDHQYFREYESF